MFLELSIEGEVPSKKNRYRIGRGKFYQDAAVTRWMEEFFYQARQQCPGMSPISSEIALTIIFYIKRDKDLDNLLNSVFDALQNSGIIKNDKLITSCRATKIKTKAIPRVEISIAAN